LGFSVSVFDGESGQYLKYLFESGEKTKFWVINMLTIIKKGKGQWTYSSQKFMNEVTNNFNFGLCTTITITLQHGVSVTYL
jgi:hypothetical protein